MLRKFESNIKKNSLFGKKDKLLLAVSGGVDSVTLAHLLKESDYTFFLAHCNFKLRKKDSDKDEAFCRKLAKELKVEIFVKEFDVKAYATQNGKSTQMAARDLRYDWFKELIQQKRFDYLLTAHHADDIVETVFINLLRGTGIKGLKGISEKSDKTVRPLLPFAKKEISDYAKRHKLKFRLDKSNLEDKYERNFLRLHVIPELKKLNPQLEKTFFENSFRFNQEADMVNEFLTNRSKHLIENGNRIISIDKEKLKQENYKETLLHFLLSPYGFNTTQQQNILENISNNSLAGKMFYSETHALTIDRKNLIIQTKEKKDDDETLFFPSLAELKKEKIFKIEKIKDFEIPNKRELVLDENKLIFPLEIRTKKTGDKFKPFGMKGFKLLSDFLKDEKLNAFEKEKCKLLVNGNGEIIWVIGRRSDERYRVSANDKNLIKFILA